MQRARWLATTTAPFRIPTCDCDWSKPNSLLLTVQLFEQPTFLPPWQVPAIAAADWATRLAATWRERLARCCCCCCCCCGLKHAEEISAPRAKTLIFATRRSQSKYRKSLTEQILLLRETFICDRACLCSWLLSVAAAQIPVKPSLHSRCSALAAAAAAATALLLLLSRVRASSPLPSPSCPRLALTPSSPSRPPARPPARPHTSPPHRRSKAKPAKRSRRSALAAALKASRLAATKQRWQSCKAEARGEAQAQACLRCGAC